MIEDGDAMSRDRTRGRPCAHPSLPAVCLAAPLIKRPRGGGSPRNPEPLTCDPAGRNRPRLHPRGPRRPLPAPATAAGEGIFPGLRTHERPTATWAPGPGTRRLHQPLPRGAVLTRWPAWASG